MKYFDKHDVLDNIWYASLTPPFDIALEGST